MVLALAVAAPARAEPPRLEMPEAVFEAGTVDAGTLIRHTFAIRNAGGADLHVTAQPGCACTVVQYDRTIAPGTVGTLTATLDTLNYKGAITKEVRLSSDDPTNGSVDLALRATVIPALDVRPSDSVVLHGQIAELKPVELALASNDGQPFDVLRADADPALSVQVAPDPAAAPARTRYRIVIAARPNVPAGRSGPIVTLVTSHPHAPPLTIRVNLDIVPAVSVEPKHVFLRPAPGDVQHVRIAKHSGPLAVEPPQPSDPGVAVTLTPVVPDHEYDLALHWTGPPVARPLRTQVTVRTNDPNQPTVVVTATVRR